MIIKIEVRDTPRPGGSKRAFYHKGKTWVVDANKHTKTWRDSVRTAALLAYKGQPIIKACRVEYIFSFARPLSHFGRGKNSQILKSLAPEYHTKKPDLTKLIRSTEDALTGIIFKDDSQCCIRSDEKRYCEPWEFEGCVIRIRTL